MSRIRALGYEEASSDVKEVFSEIESTLGIVPALFRTSAHFPPLLKANWEKVKAMMMGGNLPRKVKEAVAVLVSKDNACQYCVGAHTMALKAIGVLDRKIDRLLTEILKRQDLAKRSHFSFLLHVPLIRIHIAYRMMIFSN